ncbi:hypothetical protein ACFY4C_08310 [Actinomadura viridis]|uniref:hypothetical protein n=1 Tax=Actinomadura viridis TaxID=58110 RepID=UPI0036BDCBEF
MIRRFVAGTAMATGLALALTGCLGEAKEKAGEAGGAIKMSAAQMLGKAAEKTGQNDTFKTDMTVDSKLQQGAMKMRTVMETRLRPEVAMKMKVDPMTVGGRNIPGYEARLIGPTMYMNMPALAAANGGKPWSRISLNDVGGQAGGLDLGKMLDQAKQQSPAEQTRMFTASKDVREVGTETVGGVKTRHFTGTVTPQEALAKLDPENRKVMEGLFQQIGGKAYNFDLWVGDDDLPRKVITTMDTSMGQVTSTAIYSDYGKPVNVVAPPEAEVGDFKMPSMN